MYRNSICISRLVQYQLNKMKDKYIKIKKYVEIIGITTGLATIFFMLIFYLGASTENYTIQGIHTNQFGEHYYELSFFIIALITQFSVLNEKINKTSNWLVKKNTFKKPSKYYES